MRIRDIGFIVLALVSFPPFADGQTASNGNDWTRATELGVLTGGTSRSADIGPTLGGVAGWQMNRWVTIEGRGLWIDHGTRADGFSADITSLVNIVRKAKVTPFIGAGLGLYRATFEARRTEMPDFYGRRLGRDDLPVVSTVSFTDPMLALTAGVDFVPRRHVTIRPQASVLLVRSDGLSETMFNVGLRFGYRFDDRPLAPRPAGR